MNVNGIEYLSMVLKEVVTLGEKNHLYPFHLTCMLSNFIGLKELNNSY